MKNKIQNGGTMLHTASGSAISSGGLVLLGAAATGMAGVAVGDIAIGATGVLEVDGVFELSGRANETINPGVAVYWDADGNPKVGDAGTGCLTATAEGNQYVGRCWALANNTTGTVEVRINYAAPHYVAPA